jgi:hypothetical protein
MVRFFFASKLYVGVALIDNFVSTARPTSTSAREHFFSQALAYTSKQAKIVALGNDKIDRIDITAIHKVRIKVSKASNSRIIRCQ